MLKEVTDIDCSRAMPNQRESGFGLIMDEFAQIFNDGSTTESIAV